MNKKMSLFSFFSFTSAMVLSVYVYPTFALSGVTLIFFMLVSILFWFLPTALCSAEMASVTKWSSGGLFTWVDETLGRKWAFCAVFYQWFQVTIGFVSMLYFIVGMISVAFNLSIVNQDPIIKLVVMLSVFYFVTFLQLFGNRITSIISKSGLILGVILPVIILVSGGIFYVQSGGEIMTSLSISDLVPNIQSLNSFVTFSSFILAYLGIEASAVQIQNLNNGKKNYPKVMVYFCVFSLIVNIFAGLTISFVVNSSSISLNTGMTQALTNIFTRIAPSLIILVNIVAFILTFSTIAKISTWIVAPSKELYICVEKKLLPSFFDKKNKHDVPTRILLMQTIVTTFWCIIITLVFDGNNLAFMLSLALTVIVYLFAYLLMYLAYFKVQKLNVQRAYLLNKHRSIRMLYASIGFITTSFTLLISFIPPSQFSYEMEIEYLVLLVVSSVFIFILPLLLFKMKKE